MTGMRPSPVHCFVQRTHTLTACTACTACTWVERAHPRTSGPARAPMHTYTCGRTQQRACACALTLARALALARVAGTRSRPSARQDQPHARRRVLAPIHERLSHAHRAFADIRRGLLSDTGYGNVSQCAPKFRFSCLLAMQVVPIRV